MPSNSFHAMPPSHPIPTHAMPPHNSNTPVYKPTLKMPKHKQVHKKENPCHARKTTLYHSGEWREKGKKKPNAPTFYIMSRFAHPVCMTLPFQKKKCAQKFTSPFSKREREKQRNGEMEEVKSLVLYMGRVYYTDREDVRCFGKGRRWSSGWYVESTRRYCTWSFDMLLVSVVAGVVRWWNLLDGAVAPTAS
jgi:hypothetical protein